MADEVTQASLTPSEQTLLQQLYDNLFTRWGDVQGDDLISLRTQGLAFQYGPADLKWYAGFFEPASPLLEDQPVACTQAGATALGQPWPIVASLRDLTWKREIDRAKERVKSPLTK